MRNRLLAILAGGAAMCRVASLWAATPSEEDLFRAASREFKAGFYAQADADFGDIVQKFPASPRLPEAILFQAEARLQLTNAAGALELLNARQAQAGGRADEYQFWIAEAHFQKGDSRTAAESFGKLVREFPGSTRRLEAVIRQAAALARIPDWPRVVEVLQATNSVFQVAVRTNLTGELVQRGYLLLGEANLAQRDFASAAGVLEPLSKLSLSPRVDWERQFLLSRVLLAEGKLDAALLNSTNLSVLATNAAQPDLQVESAVFQATVFERLGRLDDAIAAYQPNLADGVRADLQRRALLKTVDLYLAKGSPADATQLLEKFLARSPRADCADLAWLTLGEVRLRLCETGNATNIVYISGTNTITLSNCLQQAVGAFQALSNYPQSSLIGKAELDLGWCYWKDGRIAESQVAFQKATQHLLFSADQATAYFKLGDAQFRQGDYRGATNSYLTLIEKFSSLPEVQTNLLEEALDQIVRANLKTGDLSAATNALARLSATFPNGARTDGAVLLTGQEIGRENPRVARKLYEDFARSAPQAARLPEVQLAIALTYEREGDWPGAMEQYENWLARYTNHEAQAQAMYYCARANSQAHRDTNALSQFSAFLTRFPTNELVPLAQWWMGGFYYDRANFEDAERNFQAVYQNTNCLNLDMKFQARMMCGRAAFQRQGWKDAKNYFGELASSTNCPAPLRAQAYYALGDTLVIISQESTNKIADYGEALSAFDQVAWLSPTNEMPVLALGGKAKCYLQAHDYGAASNAFTQVIESPRADIAARSAASVGLALALERLAEQTADTNQTLLLNLALTRCLDVFYFEKFLRPGESPDSYWTLKAGLEAVRLADRLQLKEQAANLKRELNELFPVLQRKEEPPPAKAPDPNAKPQS